MNLERIASFFTANLAMKVSALAFSVVLWAYVNSKGAIEVSLEVPVMFQEVPAGFVVANVTPDRIEVRVRGREAVVSRLSSDSVTIPISLGVGRVGENTFFIKESVVSAPRGVEVTGFSPKRVLVRLEANPVE